MFPCWLNADGPPLFHAMLCVAIGSLVEENGYVFCLHEELSHSSLVEEFTCVVTRKFGSLFFALICFSFDWRLFIVQTARLFIPCDWRGSFSGCCLAEKKGPLDSTW